MNINKHPAWTGNVSLDPASLTRLSQLARASEKRYSALRYVDYRQAERDCEILAARMLQLYSRTELDSYSFLALPRGGLIVLGMLAYILGLKRTQILPDLTSSQPLCVIDDCALTGARFAALLTRLSSSDILFVHLYSHPALRAAVIEREPRVRACLAAHDLIEYPAACDLDSVEKAAWTARWQARIGSDRYWVGRLQPVCFAWSEPDSPFWNAATEQVEDGWRYVSPSFCLKNRAALGLPPSEGLNIQWFVPRSVIVGQFDDLVWLYQSDTEQVYSLDAITADAWRAMAAYGDVDAAVRHLYSQYDVDEATLRADLEEILAQFVRARLLAPLDGASDGLR
ncbi:MAG: PqqD family protein [Anaerolineae bacterium]|nr:PqqD family protein [Anaerolineae bacterium]